MTEGREEEEERWWFVFRRLRRLVWPQAGFAGLVKVGVGCGVRRS